MVISWQPPKHALIAKQEELIIMVITVIILVLMEVAMSAIRITVFAAYPLNLKTLDREAFEVLVYVVVGVTIVLLKISMNFCN